MSGTEWTEPGQGATCGELFDWLLRESSEQTPQGYAASQNLLRIYNPTGLLYDAYTASSHTPEACWHIATNLRLTGAPLTDEDLVRIAEAK